MFLELKLHHYISTDLGVVGGIVHIRHTERMRLGQVQSRCGGTATSLPHATHELLAWGGEEAGSGCL